MDTLQDLYIDELRDIYDAESQLVKALPKMAKAASSKQLQEAFEHHLKQTQEHVKRLEKIFDDMDTNPKGETCEAMQGLIKEGEQMIKKDADSDVKDAALIASAQRVEHYEIAAYGTVCTYADRLSHTEALSTLKKTLEEEKETDAKLTDLAVNSINQKAQSS